MSISVNCAACDKTFRVSDEKRGRRIKCPACGTAVSVPLDDDADFGSAEVSSSKKTTRSRKRKKSQSSTSFGTMIGIGVAVTILLVGGLSFALKRPAVAVAPLTMPETTAVTLTPNPSGNPVNPTSDSPVKSPVATKTDQVVEPLPDPGPKAMRQMLQASEEFFGQGTIPELRIKISNEDFETLKGGPRTFVIGSPRPYVKASFTENGTTTFENVSLKLKGSAGSFRPIDDRPGLTINVGKGNKDLAFHGLSKFHLNNSVQDDTYLHEWLCEELFRSAKVPATQVTHARVWLNDRDLGLYVLKSAFDKPFLLKHFPDAKGNLYEGGFVQDLDSELEKDSGKGPDDRSDLTALLEACREPDPALRWEKIGERLHVDQFISFMAMEMMVGHWDGYTLNHNNYRLYFDRKSNQAHFLPHGMDQVFGNPNASIIDFPSSIAGSAVMLNGDWRTRYRERVRDLLPLFEPEHLQKRLDVANDRLRGVLQRMDPQAAQAHDDRVKKLKERLVARVENLIQQQSQSDPRPRDFDDAGKLALKDWYSVSESPDAKLEIVELKKGIRGYSIMCKGGGCNASWRCKTLLAKGKYVLHAKMKTEQISAAEEKDHAIGAGIRISGMTRSNVRRGTVQWTPVEFEFTVIEDVRNVEFVAEMRARRGQVWYDVESLHLTRVANE